MSSNLGYESEKTLEDNLIKQLCADGYEFVEINDIDDLHLNFRKQVNKHNASRLNGRAWMIPKDAEKPVDGRMKTRNKQEENHGI